MGGFVVPRALSYGFSTFVLSFEPTAGSGAALEITDAFLANSLRVGTRFSAGSSDCTRVSRMQQSSVATRAGALL